MQKLPDRVPFFAISPPFLPQFSPVFFLLGTFSYIFHDVRATISHFPPFSPHFPPFSPFSPFFRGLLDTRIIRIWTLPRLDGSTAMDARVILEGDHDRRSMTKVTIVGKNEIYHWENLVIFGTQTFGPRPPPLSLPIHPCPTTCIGTSAVPLAV